MASNSYCDTYKTGILRISSPLSGIAFSPVVGTNHPTATGVAQSSWDNQPAPSMQLLLDRPYLDIPERDLAVVALDCDRALRRLGKHRKLIELALGDPSPEIRAAE